MTDKSLLVVAEDLRDRLDDPNLIMVDCRFNLADPQEGRRLYEERHLPGAVFLDLDLDLAGPVTSNTGRHPLPDVATIEARLGQLGIGNDSRVVVYDGSNGALAARAWWILRWLGHQRTYLLDGGYARWVKLGYPLDSDAQDKKAREFVAQPNELLVATTDELEGAFTDIAAMNLVDARDAARFRGEVEPIDPVAGHIPGARNLPFSALVDEDGTWLDAAAREARLREVLGDGREIDWMVMCGSGVTACHIALAGIEAGYREPRVYVGSWSEWIRDSGRLTEPPRG